MKVYHEHQVSKIEHPKVNMLCQIVQKWISQEVLQMEHNETKKVGIWDIFIVVFRYKNRITMFLFTV